MGSIRIRLIFCKKCSDLLIIQKPSYYHIQIQNTSFISFITLFSSDNRLIVFGFCIVDREYNSSSRNVPGTVIVATKKVVAAVAKAVQTAAIGSTGSVPQKR